MKSLKTKIQKLTESKDDNVSAAAKELMLTFKVYEDKNKDISGYVKKKFEGIESEETKEVINYVEHKYAVDNMGMRKALKILEKSKAHKTDTNLQHLVNVYQLELMDGVPEHMLAKSFIKNFKKYENVNEAAYSTYQTISQNYTKNQAHQLVANAIYILENDNNVEFLQDVINSLNMAFNLPGSHVKAFVYQALRDRADMHPALEALLEELRLVDAKTQDKIDYYTDRFGRVAISKRLSPVLEHADGDKTFLVKNNLFVVNEKTMRKVNHEDMKKILEHADGERFLELCKIITNFKVIEGKMIANDGVNTYTIERIVEEEELDDEGKPIKKPEDEEELDDEGKPKKKEDEEESNESKYKFYINNELRGNTIKMVSESLEDDANDQIGELINMILSNFDLVNFLDGVTTFSPEYKEDEVDMMQDGNVIYVIISDEDGLMGDDVISGEAEAVAGDVKKDLGIDISGEIDDDEINEAEETDAEKEGELLELENELEIVEDNLKKIDELDESLKEDEEIKELEQELILEKETLLKRIAELNGEVENDVNKDEIIKNIIDQLMQLIQPETAIASTETEPVATQEGLAIESGKIKITPFVRYSRGDNEITFETLLNIEGLSDAAKTKILENKNIDTIAESNLVIQLRGDTEMNEEVSGILQVIDLQESDDEEELDADGKPIPKKPEGEEDDELDDEGNPKKPEGEEDDELDDEGNPKPKANEDDMGGDTGGETPKPDGSGDMDDEEYAKYKPDIEQFLAENPTPTDEQVHALADELGIEKDDVEEIIYKIAGENVEGVEGAEEIMESRKITRKSIRTKLFEEGLSGGKAELAGTKEEDVDANQLAVGIAVEMEHTDDPEVAKRVALDHLTENEVYYTDLVESGIVDEQEAIDLYNKLIKGESGEEELDADGNPISKED